MCTKSCRVFRIWKFAYKTNAVVKQIGSSIQSKTQIHESAVVNSPEDIGRGTKIWHFCHVRQGAQIGEDCVLGQNVYVAATARIGDKCRIQNNVSIYDGVILDEGVFVGPSVVFSNVKRPRTHISQHENFITTRVGKGASLGANSTIVCGVEIGEYAFVAAGSVVTKSVPPFAIVVGVPAKLTGYVCRCAQDLVADSTCEICGVSHRDVAL